MTLTIDVVNPTDAKSSAAKAAQIELPAEIFDVPANIPLIHQVVVAQLAAARSDRRAPAVPARVRLARRSSPVVAWCTARSRVVSTSGPRRR
jgi:large subunit ribosomal protein L4